jgi:hypothetical protein
MFYADLQTLAEGPFKRLTGVRRATFLDMCTALEKHLPSGGRTAKHCLQDRLLLTLMYWREYRTQYHIGQTYGLSESAVCRTIHTVEAALMRSGQFTLPGKKALTRTDIAFEVVVVDATECPVERPKKNSAGATPVRRSATPRKRRSSPTRRQSASS